MRRETKKECVVTEGGIKIDDARMDTEENGLNMKEQWPRRKKRL